MSVQERLEAAGGATEYSRAFLVGWRLAQLHANPIHMADVRAFAREGEDGLAELPERLDPQQQARLIWVGLDADLARLPGGESPEISDARTVLKTHLQNPAYDQNAISRGIEALFKLSLTNVYVINPHLAKALIVGEQLAGLVFGPADPTIARAALEARLSETSVRRTCSLLDELQSSFPCVPPRRSPGHWCSGGTR
jgi:hypothetical protein